MARTTANAASVSPDVHAEHAAASPSSPKLRTEPASLSAPGSLDASGKRSADPEKLDELNDQELLEGIRLQSEPHFAELYRRYFQRIYNFVYARMRNHAETEEVVQETFLAVFRSFGKYRGQSSLLSWIYGIAKNTTNNSIRRSKSQSERIDLAGEEDLMPRPSLAGTSPEERLEMSRFQEVVTSRLDDLADWQTEIFEMRHFENLSIPEISARTMRSSDAVRSSLYRVKRIFLDAAGGSVVAAAPLRSEASGDAVGEAAGTSSLVSELKDEMDVFGARR